MVDKRNGDGSQNDVRYDDNSGSANNGGFKSYKLGDSVKEAVSKSDSEWANKKNEDAYAQIAHNDAIMNDEKIKDAHDANKEDMETKKNTYDTYKQAVKVKGDDGKEEVKYYTEEELIQVIEEFQKEVDKFELFKKGIVDWVNEKLARYQNRATKIYTENKCVVRIFAEDGLPNRTIDERNAYASRLENFYGENFKDEMLFFGENGYLKKMRDLYNEVETPNEDINKDDGKSFLVEKKSGDSMSSVRKSIIIENFKQDLIEFGIISKKEGTNEYGEYEGEIRVNAIREVPDWANEDKRNYLHVFNGGIINEINNVCDSIGYLMKYGCAIDTAFDAKFTTDIIKKNNDTLAKYQVALDEIRSSLYGLDENGNSCDKSNVKPDSKYGEYLAAKEKYENDDYSQAEKAISIAQSGIIETNSVISNDDQNTTEETSNSVSTNIQQTEKEPEPIITPQTVLDMLGFISGMRRMTTEYPYIIQSITGLDKAYETHYGVKDPYMGSGDNKIVLTCWESLDLRVTTMFNRYFNAVYDRQYRRERVPINLRRFNCSVYVHDVRNFVTNNTNGKYANRMLELTDMYYSAIEFKFYDCEIVPEETGNIFNDISNEAPTEMKKTNFTFTYGNCVVNFVPQSEVAKYR